ncbi:hypothetical protein GOC06_30665, partial [Sinorhizobium meliloti]|nr:hypothetical protein [Sinorhizobium meliloti]
RGRLFLGIGGRDHFGIRGRIASEFASRTPPTHPFISSSASTVQSHPHRGGSLHEKVFVGPHSRSFGCVLRLACESRADLRA